MQLHMDGTMCCPRPGLGCASDIFIIRRLWRWHSARCDVLRNIVIDGDTGRKRAEEASDGDKQRRADERAKESTMSTADTLQAEHKSQTLGQRKMFARRGLGCCG